MKNQEKLLEMLQEIIEVAGAQQNKLTKDEVKKYLGEENLGVDKLQAIYRYLGENNIQVEGYDFVPVDKEEKAQDVPKDKKEEKNATEKISRSEENMKLYQQEIAQLSCDLMQEEELILSFLQGDGTVKNKIIEKYLQNVVEITKRYKNRNLPEDELIAEGNVGLMIAMQIIEANCKDYILENGKLDAKKFFGTLEVEVSYAIENYIDEMTESSDWENTVVAKTNLLHEATKYMTEEMGRVPTIEELSEYTKISREEINNIRGLSEDAKRVAQEK